MSWCTRQRHVGERRLDARRVGHDLQQVRAVDEQHVEVTAARRLDHLRRREPDVTADVEAPSLGPDRGVLVVDRFAAGERRRVGAHLGAALHAGVPADRHQPGAVAPDVAAGEADVHDRLDTVDAVGVLRDAHAPDEHRAVAPA